MPPEVLVNGRFLGRPMTGVERYTTEVLRCLGDRVRVVRPYRNMQGSAGHAWEQLSLPRQTPAQSILWSPANTGPLAVANQVLSLHDLSPLEHPEWFMPAFAAWYRLFLPLLVRRVRHIITLSQVVRQKILARFHLPPAKVHVIPGGVDHSRFKPAPGQNTLERYLLFVGSLQPRKNLPRLLEAWKLLEPRYPGVSLVLAGLNGKGKVGAENHGSGTFGKVFRPVEIEPTLKRVRLAGYVPETSLPGLYSGAEAVVLPSLDEGFGLPVLEAMACGTPVAAARSGALPEVVGDAGLLFDPQDTAALAEALDRVLSDPDLRQRLRLLGQQRAAQFSWQRTAEQVWEVLRGNHDR